MIDKNLIKKYINPEDKTIYIESDEWQALKKAYPREELVPLFVTEIMNGNIKVPMRDITLEEAIEDYKKLVKLKSTDCVIESPTTYRGTYKYPIAPRYIKSNYVGMKASDYFQQQNRWECESKMGNSPIAVWNNEESVRHIVNGMFTLDWTRMNNKTLKKIVQMRCYIASQFKPSVTKILYETLGSKDVLDFSAGWGDRLCGFYASSCTRSYIGIDPNKKVYDTYKKQADLYSSISGEKVTKFINAPAEDVVLGSEIVDTVFTSPPYFNVEHYTNEDTQSWKRYQELDEWLEKFLFKTLSMCWKALKPNGYLAINIIDTHNKKKDILMCDRMNDYIKSLGGKYVDGIGMRMSLRPNSGVNRGEGVYVEPIWIWQKTEGEVINPFITKGE